MGRTNWIDRLQYKIFCRYLGHRFYDGRYCVWCNIRRYMIGK